MPFNNTLSKGKILPSKYNVCENIEDGMLIYNTNSGGILKLNNEYKKKYDLFSKENFIEDTELKHVLIHGKMIIPKTNVNKTEQLFLENKIARFNGNGIFITIFRLSP